MSIVVNVSTLSDDSRRKIVSDLRIEDPNTKQWVYPYNVDEKTMDLSLPYAYAYQMGILPRPKSTYPTTSFSFSGKLRDYQQDVKKETIQCLNKTGSCILSLHVGWGKSVFAIYLAHKLKLKTLILVNRLVLITQWKSLLNDLCPDLCVQVLNSKSTIDVKSDVVLSNAQTIPKLNKDMFVSIGTLIVDECHLICAKTLYTAFFSITPRYLVALSATPYRPDGLDALIELYFGTCRIAKKLYRKHTVYCINTNIKVEYSRTYDGRVDWNSVIQFQSDHERRNRYIVDIITRHSDRYFLVLCKRISQGEYLRTLLQEEQVSVTDLLGNRRTFDSDARVVIATTQKCGVGFSHDKLNALILASDVEEYFIQYMGRVFRTPDVEPIIFDLVDQMPTLQKHFSSRKKVYSDCGGIIVHTKLD